MPVSAPTRLERGEASRTAEEDGLTRRAAAGDGDAFATLYVRYERRAYTLCLRILGSREDAADATQEAFVRVLRRLPALEGRRLEFGSYLFTAARHASYDLAARRGRATPTGEVPEPADPVRDTDPRDDPARNVLLDAQQEEIRRAHARLPVRQREALALRELGGLSYDEIAATMDLNRNAVAQLLSRARLTLRAHLRAGALGSVAAAGPECERALPLLAAQQDGQLDDAGDERWLRAHLAACDTCGVAREAMAEAGASYRLWVPVAAAPWLFKATMARASEAIGADWSDVIERGRPPEPAPLADRRGRRRRRDAILAAAFGTLLLLTAFAAATGERTRSAGPAEPVATAVAAPAEGAAPAAARARARRTAAPRSGIPGQAGAAPTAAPDPSPTSAAPRRATAPPSETATPRRRSAPRRTRPVRERERARETPRPPRATPVPPSAAIPPAADDDPPPPQATPEATSTPTPEPVVDPPPPPPPPRECRNAAGQPIRCPPGPL